MEKQEKAYHLKNFTKKILALFLAFFLDNQKMDGQILYPNEKSYQDSVLTNIKKHYESPEVYRKIKNFFIDLPNSGINNPDFVTKLTVKKIFEILEELQIKIVTEKELKELSSQDNDMTNSYAITIGKNIYINKNYMNTKGVLEHEIYHHVYSQLYGIIKKSNIFYFIKEYEPKEGFYSKKERINFLNYIKEKEELAIRIAISRNNILINKNNPNQKISSTYLASKIYGLFKKYQTSNLTEDFLTEKQEYFVFINTINQEDLELLEICLALDLKETYKKEEILRVSEQISYLMENLP